MTEQVLILQTGRLHEFELACNALTESNIPIFKQKENFAGLKTGMYTPVAGPGAFFNILVPAPMKSEAEKILKDLPIDLTTEPGIWHFGGKPYAKKLCKILAVIFLVAFFCLILMNTIQTIKQG